MQELVDAALAKRQAVFPGPNPNTDAFRLIDGSGDGLPGVEIDELAGHWLVSTRSSHLPPRLDAFLQECGRSVYWKRLDQHQKESPRHLAGPPVDEPFLARENGVRFELSFQSGYSQGIFLDQRDNRLALRQALGPDSTLLNTFAYTGAFSVSASLTGTTTTTLDLSQPYLDWAKRNFAHNQVDPSSQYFCKGDTFHWLRRFAKQGRRFDAVVLDPPTFSRDQKGQVFRVEKDYARLVELAAACLETDGVLLACTNCRQLSDEDFEHQVRSGFSRPVTIHSAPMPADFTGEAYLKSLWVR